MPLPRTFVLLLLAATTLSLACSACRDKPDEKSAPGLPTGRVTVHRSEGEPLEFTVEVVASDRARQRGLMFRDDLAPDRGMLFLFEKEEEHPFWMKNTRIALDMLFINEAHEVVGIIHKAEPFKEKSLTVGLPSRYVLEVRGGTCARQGIHRGATVSLDLPGRAGRGP